MYYFLISSLNDTIDFKSGEKIYKGINTKINLRRKLHFKQNVKGFYLMKVRY